MDTSEFIKWGLLLVVGGLGIIVLGYILNILFSASSENKQKNIEEKLARMNNTGMSMSQQEFTNTANDLLRQVREIADNPAKPSLFFSWLDERLDRQEVEIIERKLKHIGAIIALAKQLEEAQVWEESRGDRELERRRSKEHMDLLHQLSMRRTALEGMVIEAAAKMGRSVISYETWQATQDQIEADEKRSRLAAELKRQEDERAARIKAEDDERASRLRRQEKEAEARVTTQTEKEKAKIKLDTEKAEAEAELIFGEKATRPGAYNEINLLKAKISEIAEDVDRLKAIKKKTGAQKIDLEEALRELETYRGRKRDLEAELYQTPNRQKSQGTGQAAAGAPEDPR
jgi:hypothetical protein